MVAENISQTAFQSTCNLQSDAIVRFPAPCDASGMGKRRRISLGPPKGNFIQAWRKYRGLTQEQLGERLGGLGASHISQLETGKLSYTQEKLDALAYALNCEPGDLISRDPRAPAYQLWQVINGMKPEQQARALKIVKALIEDAA